MSNALRPATLVVALAIGAGEAVAEDPRGPNAPAPREPAALLSMPTPGPVPIEREGRPVAPATDVTVGQAVHHHLPPPMPPAELTAARDAEVDAMTGVLPPGE